MKGSFYKAIALGNVKKNYRFFIPRIISEAGLFACFYIIFTLSCDERICEAKGGDYIPFFMQFGTFVIGILTVILLLYTNSFFIKQRKKEFGLYNVLGMEKRHIGRVLFWESAISSVVSIVLGLALGMLFYKICSLFICQLLKTDLVFGLYFIKLSTIIPSILIFIAIDLFAYFVNRISIKRMKIVDLLHSKNVGEKEPKINWVLLAVGIVSLGAGYYLAVSVKNALAAIMTFFLAVILVIIGTYFLFVSGSIFTLKVLKKNKKYYYNKKHFSTVAGLIHRMKQNAVGLASVAVLSTGVIILISCTGSLYGGMQSALDKSYPEDLYASGWYAVDEGDIVDWKFDELRWAITNSAEEAGVEIKSIKNQRYLEVAYLYEANEFKTKADAGKNWNPDDVTALFFITADMYNELTGNNVVLADNEILICNMTEDQSVLKTPKGTTVIQRTPYKIAGTIEKFPISCGNSVSVTDTYGVVLANEEAFQKIYSVQKNEYEEAYSEIVERIAVTFADITEAEEKGEQIGDGFFRNLDTLADAKVESESVSVSRGGSLDAVWSARESMLGMYSSFLFLGVMLGFVCFFGTTLIIYYKQISEGYEDRERFQIMKKVGMSDKEIKGTIGPQILLMFAIPVVVAGIHMIFAFTILSKLLKILMLSSIWFFVGTSIIVYILFALIYVMIYIGTSRTYYKIVK